MDAREELDDSNRQLAEALASQILGTLPRAGAQPADGAATPSSDDPAELDFISAMNAFRAAREAGDPDAMALAEKNLQQVVRDELTGDGASE